MGVRVDADAVKAVRLGAGEGVEFGDALQLLAEEGEAPGAILKVGGPDFERIAADTEAAALKGLIVAAVLLGDEVGEEAALVVSLALDQVDGHGGVGFDRADAVDAGDRGHDDDVVAFEERTGRRVAHPVDLFVDLAFFLDVGVRARDVGFGLVVVVVADEVFHRVVGEEALEFAVELRGERLVWGKDDGGALGFLDHLGHGEGLAGAGRAEEDLVAVAVEDAGGKFGDGGGLVARRFEFGLEAETAAAFELFPAVGHHRRQIRHVFGRVVVHWGDSRGGRGLHLICFCSGARGGAMQGGSGRLASGKADRGGGVEPASPSEMSASLRQTRPQPTG